jgi:peptidoglycan/xylan/chitin deacetylase (PgdA/CDA1 family)
VVTPRHVLVCIDYEGQWGMPFAARYDLTAATGRILETLAAHRVRAIFFVVGALAVERPDLIRAIADAGHETACHGWQHDCLTNPTYTRFADELETATSAIASTTGRRPVGFRAPYLLAPAFFDDRIYELLCAHSYKWTSNLEIRRVVELLRPDLTMCNVWRLANRRRDALHGTVARALEVPLNPKIVRGRNVRPHVGSTIRWLLSGAAPMYRGELLEIPVYSPMDCDLIGLPEPASSTPERQLRYAKFALKMCVSSPRPLAMVTFHDWIIATGNRLQLLDAVLSFIKERNLHTTTVTEAWPELLRLAPGTVRQ